MGRESNEMKTKNNVKEDCLYASFMTNVMFAARKE
jgi:hypothetical protein